MKTFALQMQVTMTFRILKGCLQRAGWALAGLHFELQWVAAPAVPKSVSVMVLSPRRGRGTGGWFAAPPGARTIPSATSSRADLTVRPSAGTSTSLLCYKRSEMLREFLHLCRRGLLHLGRIFWPLVCCCCKSSSVRGDLSKCCSCYHIVHSLHGLYREMWFFKN